MRGSAAAKMRSCNWSGSRPTVQIGLAPPQMMRRGLGRSASAAAIAADWQELQIARRERFREVLAKSHEPPCAKNLARIHR